MLTQPHPNDSARRYRRLRIDPVGYARYLERQSTSEIIALICRQALALGPEPWTLRNLHWRDVARDLLREREHRL